jgi:tRNA(Arg) A34 adenosine deaminase TadA
MKSTTRFLRPIALGALIGVGVAVLVVLGRGEPRAEDSRSACDAILIDRLLQVTEQEIVPLTRKGVEHGNKLFGAAILRKSDLSLVLASTNHETENPLWHGEVQAIKTLYEMPRSQRPAPKESIFFATHEPCPLCLSAITWGGYDNFYYLFSYEDSRDSFNIPHDTRILKEVFRPEGGTYAHENEYWKAHDLMKMIGACNAEQRSGFEARVDALKQTYAELSGIYQRSKSTSDADIPLK